MRSSSYLNRMGAPKDVRLPNSDQGSFVIFSSSQHLNVGCYSKADAQQEVGGPRFCRVSIGSLALFARTGRPAPMSSNAWREPSTTASKQNAVLVLTYHGQMCFFHNHTTPSMRSRRAEGICARHVPRDGHPQCLLEHRLPHAKQRHALQDSA